jgi:hypothetical protein
MTINVNWCPFQGKSISTIEKRSWMDMLWFEPEPLLKHVVSERNKDLSYLKCPSFIDFCKNTFVIRSPLDIDISFDYDTVTERKYIKTHMYNQEFYDDFITDRMQEGPYTMLGLVFGNLFYAEQSLVVEQMPATFSRTSSVFQKNITVIPGRFDISKLIRPVSFAFEIVDDTQIIKIKRGDPLYYLRFITDEPVKINRVKFTDELKHVVYNCVSVKDFVKNNSLEENYALAKPLIDLFRGSLFKKKSKCPFGFGK